MNAGVAGTAACAFGSVENRKLPGWQQPVRPMKAPRGFYLMRWADSIVF
jgi:hypothetical protein